MPRQPWQPYLHTQDLPRAVEHRGFGNSQTDMVLTEYLGRSESKTGRRENSCWCRSTELRVRPSVPSSQVVGSIIYCMMEVR